LFRIALRVTGGRGEAEDVLQEVYLIVWRRAAAFDPAKGSADAWLATIARRRAIDAVRSRPATENGKAAEAALQEAVCPEPLAFALMEKAESIGVLAKCLDELQPKQAQLIRAAFYGGATYVQLARRSGVPVPTMKSWIRRGLIELRNRYECSYG
jgi:RNA polymerase sigma-70 factor (ECF subfamily)